MRPDDVAIEVRSPAPCLPPPSEEASAVGRRPPLRPWARASLLDGDRDRGCQREARRGIVRRPLQKAGIDTAGGLAIPALVGTDGRGRVTGLALISEDDVIVPTGPHRRA